MTTPYTGLDDFLDSSRERGEIVGSWGFSSNIDFTRMRPEESNVWFFEQVFNFLRAYFGVVMPDSLEITTYNSSQQVTRNNLDPMTFLDELMLVMKNLKEHIWTLKLGLSIVGFIRADWDPEKQIRVRIQEPANLMVWGGPDESGFQSFSITYNLFSSQVITGEGVSVWSVNQPMLGKALHKWEQQTGRTIDVVRGNSPELSLSRQGFDKPVPDDFFADLEPPETRAARKPMRPAEPTGDDLIPDLDDLLL